MAGVVTRDLDEVRGAFTAWYAHRHPALGDVVVELVAPPAAGYSNEIIFATVTTTTTTTTTAATVSTTATTGAGGRHEERLVLRLPPNGPALFPHYDLAMQVAVQAAVAGHDVPVPAPITLEADERWLGAPFLVMPLVAGHCPGEVPVIDPWIADATVDQQRRLHEGFLDVLARIHTTPWSGRPVARHLRGATSSLADELRWWEDLVTWTFAGSPPAAIIEVLAWCRKHRPRNEPALSVLWGDVRLGNLIVDDTGAPVAVLDWEMASIGPAEMDLAWYTALDAMTAHFFGRTVPGFLTRDQVVARHEQALGRPLVAFAWFEVFAMVRSAALSIRADRLDAQRRARAPRPAADNAVLAYTLDAISAIDAVS